MDKKGKGLWEALREVGTQCPETSQAEPKRSLGKNRKWPCLIKTTSKSLRVTATISDSAAQRPGVQVHLCHLPAASCTSLGLSFLISKMEVIMVSTS